MGLQPRSRSYIGREWARPFRARSGRSIADLRCRSRTSCVDGSMRIPTQNPSSGRLLEKIPVLPSGSVQAFRQALDVLLAASFSLAAPPAKPWRRLPKRPSATGPAPLADLIMSPRTNSPFEFIANLYSILLIGNSNPNRKVLATHAAFKAWGPPSLLAPNFFYTLWILNILSLQKASRVLGIASTFYPQSSGVRRLRAVGLRVKPINNKIYDLIMPSSTRSAVANPKGTNLIRVLRSPRSQNRRHALRFAVLQAIAAEARRQAL